MIMATSAPSSSNTRKTTMNPQTLHTVVDVMKVWNHAAGVG